jgi:membrane protease YdiL (CAAX protease family)
VSPLKKTALILIAILAMEAFPLSLTLAGSRPGFLFRLYGFDARVWPAWLLAGAVTFAYILYAARALPLVGARMFSLHWLKWLALPFAIVTGSFEELFFRKMLMDGAASAGAAALSQVALSALVFGAAHAVWGLFGRQWRMALGAALSTGVLGALLALVYLAAGRQLAPCIWAHMLINLALEPWLILAAVSAFPKARPSEGMVAEAWA